MEELRFQIWQKGGNAYESSHVDPVSFGYAVRAVCEDPSLTGREYEAWIVQGDKLLGKYPFTAKPAV